MRYEKTRFMENVYAEVKEKLETEGPYDIPIIKPEEFYPVNDWIRFNDMAVHKVGAGLGVHFFTDDYRFERLWHGLEKYSDIMGRFEAVMAPDWTWYSDWPFALQVYNHYRKHFVAAYLQQKGIRVYPTICLGTEESFSWCFDGEPRHATVCVSSVGTQGSEKRKMGFLRGYDAMLEQLEPETVIFYGHIPKECMGNIIHVKAHNDRFREARIGDFA